MIDNRLRVLFPRPMLLVFAVLLALLLFLPGCSSWFPSFDGIGSGGSGSGGKGPPSPTLWDRFGNTESLLYGLSVLFILGSIAAIFVPLLVTKTPPCVKCAIACGIGWATCLGWIVILKYSNWILAGVGLAAAGYVLLVLKAKHWNWRKAIKDPDLSTEGK